MKVALNGKLQRVTNVFGGNIRAVALNHGEKKLWPSDGNYAMGLRVELPKPGTLDYLYWLHVQRAMQGVDAGSANCYLRFTINNGTHYYINKSPDGSAPLRMEGEVIQLTSGVRTILADYIGSTLPFGALVPAHTSDNFTSPAQNVGFAHTLLEPWLPGTTLTYSHWKGQKKVCSWASGNLVGLRTGRTYITAPWHNHPGHWRGDSTHTHGEVAGLVPDYTAEPLRLSMEVGGSSGISACRLTYPAFWRIFNLKVKEVY